MYFIELTNASEEYDDAKLCINFDHIISVVKDTENEDVTIIFSLSQNVWKVKEDYDTVVGFLDIVRSTTA